MFWSYQETKCFGLSKKQNVISEELIINLKRENRKSTFKDVYFWRSVRKISVIYNLFCLSIYESNSNHTHSKQVKNDLTLPFILRSGINPLILLVFWFLLISLSVWHWPSLVSKNEKLSVGKEKKNYRIDSWFLPGVYFFEFQPWEWCHQRMPWCWRHWRRRRRRCSPRRHRLCYHRLILKHCLFDKLFGCVTHDIIDGSSVALVVNPFRNKKLPPHL